MKVKLKIETEFDVKYLLAEVGARYWEDSEVNGEEDIDGKLIPCRDGDYWKPLIDIETGQIINWERGKTAKIHYKSYDDNLFKLLDKDSNVIISRDGYVINSMSPAENGYGDYVIMAIDQDGFIEDWEFDVEEFTEVED
jgi:hypothetical protein